MARVDLDVVPQVARPAAIDAALADAAKLRDRYRRSQEELAGLEADLQRLEQDDVAQAAERIRAGSPAGNVLAGVTKARASVETAKRNSAASGLAAEGCQDDLAEALSANAPAWLDALDDEAGRARERAAQALTEFEAALGDLTASTSASLWLRSAQADGRFDRHVPLANAGSSAPSSRRMTANGEALRRDEVIGFARELVGEKAAGALVAGPGEPATSRVLAQS